MEPKDKTKQIIERINMEPKDKAKQIIERYESGLTLKDCAMICVSEMIDVLDGLELTPEVIEQFAYLQEVKLEIKKL